MLPADLRAVVADAAGAAAADMLDVAAMADSSGEQAACGKRFENGKQAQCNLQSRKHCCLAPCAAAAEGLLRDAISPIRTQTVQDDYCVFNSRYAAYAPVACPPGNHLCAFGSCFSGRQEAGRHSHWRSRHPRRQVWSFTTASPHSTVGTL